MVKLTVFDSDGNSYEHTAADRLAIDRLVDSLERPENLTGTVRIGSLIVGDLKYGSGVVEWRSLTAIRTEHMERMRILDVQISGTRNLIDYLNRTNGKKETAER